MSLHLRLSREETDGAPPTYEEAVRDRPPRRQQQPQQQQQQQQQPARTPSSCCVCLCISFCGLWYLGVVLSAALGPMRAASGACCLNTTCILAATERACVLSSGTFAGAATSCTASTCTPAIGACCAARDAETPVCFEALAETACTAAALGAATFLATSFTPGVACTLDACPGQTNEFACCTNVSAATECTNDLTSLECADASGTYNFTSACTSDGTCVPTVGK